MSTRLAEPVIQNTGLPQYCSACFNQDSEVRHIDFDASCDRGFYGSDPATHVTMDDLILCESCIGEAARQLGYEKGTQIADENKVLKHRLEQEQKRADKAEAYAERMEEALKHRPTQLKVSPPRKRGRPAKVQEED